MAPSLAFIVITESNVRDCDAILRVLQRALKPMDEVIVLTRDDQASQINAIDRSWCRVVGIPSASIFPLRARIPTLSKSDWLIVLEEHSLVTVEAIEVIRNVIDNQPDIDLIVFLGKNLTSLGPWDWAIFLHTFALIWAPVDGPPPFSPVTSAVVRRAALDTDTVLREGEWELHTIPRIFARGRFAYSNDIYINHVRHLNMISGPMISYHNARAGAGISRLLERSKRDIVSEGWFAFIERPPQLARARAKRWKELPSGTLWRMHVVGLFHLIGNIVGALFGPGQSAHKID